MNIYCRLPPDCTPHLSVEARLINFLLRRYRKIGRIARPVHDANTSVSVDFGLGLIQVLDFDETNQVLTTSVWKRFVRNLFSNQSKTPSKNETYIVIIYYEIGWLKYLVD